MLKRILMIATFLVTVCVSCFAHSMPGSEMVVGGVGIGCNLRYVKSVYGYPMEIRPFNTDGVKGVTYVYSPAFSITGRTSFRDTRPEDELMVVSFKITNGYLATPSGIRVGDHINKVFNLFGSVPSRINYQNRKGYDYSIGSHCMTFYVNNNNIINEIYAGTDW